MTNRVTGWFAASAGAALALAAVAALYAPAANAQAQAATPAAMAVPSASAPAAAVPVADDRADLTAFARAAKAVGALRDAYMPRITAANIAGRAARAEALFGEMRARMHDAIDAAGLTVTRYEDIAERAERDADLRARIEAILTGSPLPPEPELGVSAPSPEPVGEAAPGADPAELAAAQARIDELEERLSTELSRAAAERDARKSLEGAIERLGMQISDIPRLEGTVRNQNVALDEAQAQLARALAARADAEAARAAAEQARDALTRDAGDIALRIGAAVEALAVLEVELGQALAPAEPGIATLSRLDAAPTLLSGNVPTLARDLTAVQSRDTLRARLETEKTRNITMRAEIAAERTALRRELVRIACDLDVNVARLAGALDAKPENSSSEIAEANPVSSLPSGNGHTSVAAELAVPEVSYETRPHDPMYDDEVHIVMAAALDLDAVAISADDIPPPAIVGSVLDGIEAHEAKDYARAYTIWHRLAVRGVAAAQFHLGALYFEGRGVARDLDAARHWLDRAQARGIERAEFLLTRVAAAGNRG